MREVTLVSIEEYGLIVVDEEKKLLWEWLYPVEKKGRIAGIDVDPKTGNIFVAGFTEIVEVNRKGKVIWSYSHPLMIDLHSLQLLGNGNVLVSCAMNDRALEINKESGVVWSWWAGHHYEPPKWYRDYEDWRTVRVSDWTHLNHAWRNGDKTILSLHNLNRVVEVDEKGEILWEWGDSVLNGPHYVIPHRKDYLISDTGNDRIVRVNTDGEIISVLSHPKFDKPRAFQILPNGSLLVTNAYNRKILEVAEQEIVWEYELPKTIVEKCDTGRPYTSLRLEDWDIGGDLDEELIKRLRALGYM